MSCGRADGFLVRNAFYVFVTRPQQIVCAILYPAGDIGVRRAAIGRVVLETSVLGRIMRWRDHDPVGEVFLPAKVVDENGMRDHGRRRYTAIFLNDSFYSVGGEHFEGSLLCRF